MRIGLVTDTYLPDVNGVVSSIVTLKKALEKAGDTVFIITNHAKPYIEFEDGVLRLPGMKLKMLYGYKMSSPINIGGADYLRSMDLDVIHLQTNFGVGIYGQYLASALKIPAVVTYHTMYEDYTHYINPMNFSGFDKVSREAIRAVSRKMCNSMQAVISPSEKTKEILQQYGVIAPIYVVPTGLDLDAFSQACQDQEKMREIRSRVSDDPSAKILVFVGRIAKEKTLEMPIQAISLSKDPNLHLAVVGAGPDEDYYRKLTEDLGASDRVHFLGKCDPSEVAGFYAAFDGFVSASLSETQGMTYLEAMATGTMVFGRRDEVLKDLLEEGETGFYFDTPEELLEKAERFFAMGQEEKEACAEKCRRKIQPYTDETFAYKAKSVYYQAIEDYSNTFDVDKIRIDADYAFLTLSRSSSKEPVKIMIPLEDYFEQKISLNSKLDSYMVTSWLSLQDFYNCMYRTKHLLASRDMTSAQAVNYCVRKLNAPKSVAEEAARELVSLHLIDDRQYALDKSAYWHDVGSSRRQISEKLYRAGISSDLIEEALGQLNEDVENRNAKALAARLVKGLKTQSSRMKKQKLIAKLRSRGYSAEAAREACEDLVLEDDQDALDAAVSKAERMYCRLDPEAAARKIRTYCLRQGFERSDIDAMMEAHARPDEPELDEE